MTAVLRAQLYFTLHDHGIGTRALGSNPTVDLFASHYSYRLAHMAVLPAKSVGEQWW
jgi:hypothetical protein